jgi:hypothetical protein
VELQLAYHLLHLPRLVTLKEVVQALIMQAKKSLKLLQTSIPPSRKLQEKCFTLNTETINLPRTGHQWKAVKRYNNFRLMTVPNVFASVSRD